MTWIALLRHGITEWNELGLIQGRTDIPLNATGVAQLQQTRRQLCDAFLHARWVTSPLQRARQTAAILNPGAEAEAEVQPALIEANWGAFEGMSRRELPDRIRALALKPHRGLDFLPPGGESPRMVRRRLLRWLQSIAETDIAVVAVTHKGVIRSALSAACQWDMNTDFRPKADWSLPHLFRLHPHGVLRLERLNCPWDHPPDADRTP